MELLNKELEGLDPFSPDLTTVQMNMMVTEALLNPMFFYTCCRRTPALSYSLASVVLTNPEKKVRYISS